MDSAPNLKLQLTGERWVNHFTFAIAPVLLFIVVLAVSLWSGASINSGKTTIVLFIFFALSVFSIWWHQRTLRFKVFKSPYSAKENHDRFLALAERRQWLINEEMYASFIEVSTPRTFFGYGQMITVRFFGNHVYVCSIIDPDDRPTPVTFWVNLENFRLIADELCAPNPPLNSDPTATV